MGDTQAKTLDQLIEIMDNEKTTLTKREVSLVSRAWDQSMQVERESLQSQLSEANREASGLAMSLWKNHYKDESPNFGLCDTVAGIITQIDNMVAGINEQLSEARAQRDALLIAGHPMSNACYNLSQWEDRLPDGQAEALKELQEDWDAALSSLRQQG